jgi:hypothetical protein
VGDFQRELRDKDNKNYSIMAGKKGSNVMIFKGSMKNKPSIKLPDGPETLQAAFRVIEKHGPRDESRIGGREFKCQQEYNLFIKVC